MKKRILVLAVFFIFCLSVSACIGADEDIFRFQDTWTWGMDQKEVTGNLKPGTFEFDCERKLDYLEVDDDRYTWENVPAELKFGFKNGELAVIQLSFDTEDRGVSGDKVLSSLEALYGKSEDAADEKVLDDLMAMVDPDEIEMALRRNDTVRQWALDNGTIILMKVEAGGDDIDVVFFDGGFVR